jgi:hypothetical protein
MGTLHEGKRQLDKAFWDYSQALLADSYLLAAYVGLQESLFRSRDGKRLYKVTDQLVRVNAMAFPVAYLYKAAASFNLGNFAAAKKNAREFQSLDTKHERPQVYLLLGDTLAREHDYAGAAEQKKIFLTIVPNAYDADEIKKQIKVLESNPKALYQEEFRRSAVTGQACQTGRQCFQ